MKISTKYGKKKQTNKLTVFKQWVQMFSDDSFKLFSYFVAELVRS